MYLWPSLTGAVRAPGGYDTPKYLWRATLVETRGLRALGEPSLSPLIPMPERAGFPALASLAEGALGIPPLRLLYVLPAVAAVAAGLAAAAFALAAMNEPPWSAGVYAVVVGGSVTIARTAIGYTDQLLMDPIAVAAATLAVLTAAGERSMLAPAVLLAAAFVTHWIFAGTLAGVLAVVALLLVPLSVRRRRDGAALGELPAVRLTGALVASGAIVGALAVLAGVHAARVGRPRPTALVRKFHLFADHLRLAWLLPAAALGSVAAWFGADRRDVRRRIAAAVAVVWAALGVVGLVAFGVLGLRFPAYRLLVAAVGLPILGAAFLVGAARVLAGRLRPVGTALACAVVLFGSTAAVAAGWQVWRLRVPAFTVEQARQATVAGRYLRTVPDRPAIIVVTGVSIAKQDRVVRSMMPPDQIVRPRIFIGSAADLLAGRPTVSPNARITSSSAATFRAVRPLLGLDPVVIALSAFGRRLDRTTEFPRLAPGVSLVRGDPPSEPISTALNLGPSAPRLVADLVLMLAAVSLAGLGWAWRAVPGRAVAAVALAPATGIAALCLVGVVIGTLGANTAHHAVWIGSATAVLGWLRLPSHGGRRGGAAGRCL
jgi:hypothetical protein